MKIKITTLLIITSIILSGVIIQQSIKTNKTIVSLIPETEYNHKLIVREIIDSTVREVTAYNAGDPSQCSGNPCISANGENICLALEQGYKRCAANFVPLGTDIRVSSPISDWSMICKVTDRMNSRYFNRVDIAMTLEEKQRAKNFGLQNLLVEVLGEEKLITKK